MPRPRRELTNRLRLLYLATGVLVGVILMLLLGRR
jgi:hypothetical protein